MALLAIALCACSHIEDNEQQQSLTGGDPKVGQHLIYAYGCGTCHAVAGILHPRGNGHGTNVASLAAQVRDDDQNGNHRSVAQAAGGICRMTINQALALGGGKPIDHAHTSRLTAFTRAIPAASSGLSNPVSAASNASLRTAAK